MKSYVLSYVDSGATSEILADSDSDGIRKAINLVGEGAIDAESWDQDGHNDDGQQCKRVLIWASEAAREADPTGANAVASLSTIGTP